MFSDIIITMERRIKLKKVKRKRKHGFLARKKTHGGREVIKRRVKRGRKRIAI